MLCGKGFTTEPALTAHETDVHGVNCDICDVACFTEFDLNCHKQACHKSKSDDQSEVLGEASQKGSTCDYCPHTASCEKDLERHVIENHQTELVDQIVNFEEFSHNCTLCIFGSDCKLDLSNHMLKKHGENSLPSPQPKLSSTSPPRSFQCEQCGMVFGFLQPLHDHLTHEHSKKNSSLHDDLPFPCSNCGKIFGNIADLKSHVISNHSVSNGTPDTQMFRVQGGEQYMGKLLDQNLHVIEEMKNLRESLSSSIKDIVSNQAVLQEEILKVAHSNKQLGDTVNRVVIYLDSGSKRMESLESQIGRLESQQCAINQSVDRIQTAVITVCKRLPDPVNGTPAQNVPPVPSTTSADVSPPSKNKAKSCLKCGFIIHSDEHLQKHNKVRHPVKENLLWVGDSINSNVDLGLISSKTGMNIKAVKAFTVSTDTENSTHPEPNFIDVVEEELESGTYNVLVLGGGSVDISNLNTVDNQDENITEYREKTIVSAQKMFCIAESALQTHTSLKKVVILKRTPRFDQHHKDPLGLKQQLSALADSFYFGLWCSSRFKGSIVLGDHDNPLSGDASHRTVFGNPDDDEYDGIHLCGPEGKKMFTSSVLKMLLKAGLISGADRKQRRVADKPGIVNDYDPLAILKKDMEKKRHSDVRKPSPRSPLIPSSRPSVISATNQLGGRTDTVCSQPMQASTRRSSVIQPAALQGKYSIPVSNTFDLLGNC